MSRVTNTAVEGGTLRRVQQACTPINEQSHRLKYVHMKSKSFPWVQRKDAGEIQKQ